MTNEAKAARAAELFGQGMSVNAVAKALEIDWTAAKKLKPGGASVKKAKTETPADEPAETAEVATEALVWLIALEVPADRIGDLVGSIAADELKAAIVRLLDGAAQSVIFQAVLALRVQELLAN